MATKEYELKADYYHEVKLDDRGQLRGYTPYVKGDKIKLDDDRAKELIEAGAIVDPSDKGTSEPGGQTEAPKSGDSGGQQVQVPEGDPNETWTLAQMKAWGDANNVDLTDVKKKDEALAAIASARA